MIVLDASDLKPLRGQLRPAVEHIAISPNGRLLALSGPSRPFELWNVQAAERWPPYADVSYCYGPVAFHPTKPVCFPPNQYALLAINTETRRMTESKDAVSEPAFAPDGNAFVSRNNVSGGVELRCYGWRARGPLKRNWSRLLKRFARGLPNEWAVTPRVNPTGETLAILEGPHTRGRSRFTQLRAWRMKDGEPLAVVEVPAGTNESIAFTADGAHVVTRAAARLTVRKARTLEIVREVKLGRASPAAVAFHPGGQYFAALVGPAVHLYDARTWAHAKTLEWGIGKLRCIAFSPDGALAAAGSDKGQVVVWDVDL